MSSKTRVMGLQGFLSAHPKLTILFLKNTISMIFFHSFLQIKLIFWHHKPFVVGQNRIILYFLFLNQKHEFKQTEKLIR